MALITDPVFEAELQRRDRAAFIQEYGAHAPGGARFCALTPSKDQYEFAPPGQSFWDFVDHGIQKVIDTNTTDLLKGWPTCK